MTRLTARRILFSCVTAGVLLLFVTICFVWLPLPRPDGGISITAVGVTNDSVRGRLSVFAITNQSNSTIGYWVGSPQTRSDDDWSKLAVPMGASDLFLQPHQIRTFLVDTPSSGSTWRVPVFWFYTPTGLARVRGTLRYNLGVNGYLLRHGRKPKLLQGSEGDEHVSYSPELHR